MHSDNIVPVFDGHNDTLLMTYLQDHMARPFFKRSETGHIDLPRAREGGLFGGLFALFIPHPETAGRMPPAHGRGKADAAAFRILKPVSFSYASEMVWRGIRALNDLVSRSQGALTQVTSIADIRRALKNGNMATVLHFEGAEPIDPDLENLEDFHRAGLRSIGLVWSRPNAFGHGVHFDFPGTPDTGPGLTEAGKRLVRRCNEMGILVDLSHLNEKGFWDVERLTDSPLAATHSCVHALCPTPRNLTDAQLDAIAASDGVVGINFGVAFIREDGKHNAATPLSDMVRHFRYIADRAGVDHVAMGSDFDGALISRHLKDAAGLPKLIRALRQDGFGESDIEKICWKNWLRVLKKAWKSPTQPKSPNG